MLELLTVALRVSKACYRQIKLRVKGKNLLRVNKIMLRVKSKDVTGYSQNRLRVKKHVKG